MDIKKVISAIDKGDGIYKIYGIIDLNSKELIYIGITKRKLGSRLSDHKCSNYLGNNNIGIVLITNTDNFVDEGKYISMFKALGCNLLNKNSIENGEYKIIDKLSEEERRVRRIINQKIYYIKNKDRLQERMRIYNEENKDRLREYRKEFYSKRRYSKL